MCHAASKINRNDKELRQPQFKAMRLSFVKKAKQKRPFHLLNFRSMDNRVHLLVKPGEGQSLSKIIRRLKRDFAKRRNKAHHTEGRLWEERFLKAFRHINEKSVSAKTAAKAEEWEYGLRHALRGRLGVVDMPRKAMLRLFFDTV